MRDLDDIQADIGTWANLTFPKSTPETWAKHLMKEASELYSAIKTGEGDKALGEECADVAILLCAIAHRSGISLAEAIHSKMEVNKSRTWGEPDAEGVVEHIKQAELYRSNPKERNK